MTEGSSIGKKAFSGVIWASINQFGTQIFNFVSSLILSRILSVSDFGCIGMLTIFIAISSTFIDSGFGTALIQKKNANQNDFSTIFFWNIFLSFVVYGILYFSAPAIAVFFHTPILSKVLKVLGIVLIINALGSVQSNILRKKLRFKKFSIINIVAVFCSAIVGIFLALNDYGVWSLVFQQITLALVNTILYWIFNDWYPSFVFDIKAFKVLFRYGGFMFLSSLINTIASNIQGLIIGRKFTSNEMGLYSQSVKFRNIPSNAIPYIITQVLFPVFSQVQDNKEELKRLLKNGDKFLFFLICPLMVLLIIIARPLFILLYTTKWVDAVPYFQLLCIGGIAICMCDINYYVIAAVGKSKEIFKWTILKRINTVLFVLIGMYFGIYGVIIGSVIANFSTYTINAFLIHRYTTYKFFEQIKDLLGTLIIVILTGAFSVAIFYYLDINMYIEMFLEIIVYALIYLTLSYLFNKNILKGILSLIKKNI